MSELTVGTIVLPPLIVALVALAQRAGMPVTWAPWLNAFLSVAGYALVLLVGQRPDLLPSAQMGLTALAIFLSAAGIYDRVGGPARSLAGRTD